jgi:soluble lytic murein transglycosylase-like protein
LKRALLISFVLAGWAGWIGHASADIAILHGDRTLKISSWCAENGLMRLVLKGGGVVGLPEDQIAGIVPDEIMEEIERAKRSSDKGEIEGLAVEIAKRHKVDPQLVLAVIRVESAFEPQAVSPKGAQGLMQLMPATAGELGVDDPFDPTANIDGGVRYLSQLLQRYGGDRVRALAAYNAGAGAVDRHRGVPPYRETRSYVRKVLDRCRTVAQ